LVVIDDGLETIPMAIEIVFVPDGVEVPDPAGRVAEQGVRKLIERADLRFIAQTSDLKKVRKISIKLACFVE